MVGFPNQQNVYHRGLHNYRDLVTYNDMDFLWAVGQRLIIVLCENSIQKNTIWENIIPLLKLMVEYY